MSGRAHPPHFPPIERHNTAIIVLVSVATDGRKPLLDSASVHARLRSCWLEATDWLVGRYVLMPDHLHLFCAPGRLDYPALLTWVGFWKSRAAARWPSPHEGRVWQRDFWDRQIRNGEHYDQKWEYVRENPVRAGLVASWRDWPYQGELHGLRWFDA